LPKLAHAPAKQLSQKCEGRVAIPPRPKALSVEQALHWISPLACSNPIGIERLDVEVLSFDCSSPECWPSPKMRPAERRGRRNAANAGVRSMAPSTHDSAFSFPR